jgi:hypothetical protein
MRRKNDFFLLNLGYSGRKVHQQLENNWDVQTVVLIIICYYLYPNSYRQ